VILDKVEASMPASVLAQPATFHLSLNVADLNQSVAFFRILFDAEPAKRHGDYAKFEVIDPPVVLSLCPRSAGAGGALSHVGLQVEGKEIVDQFAERLVKAGMPFQRQSENKLWIKDPDETFWEIYVHEGSQLPPEASSNGPKLAVGSSPPAGPLVWEHYLTTPLMERIPHANDSVDEIRLTGTFNSDLDECRIRSLLQEAFRVLKPGGKVVAHGLMADRPFPGSRPRLPGLAALVVRIPIHTEAMDSLVSTGLVGIQAVKFTETPWFVHDGVEMREIKLIGWKPLAKSDVSGRQFIYRGPFKQVVLDGGIVCRRGERMLVPEKVWRQLQVGSAAKQFLFVGAADDVACSCS
jgi:hypothetical protein